MLSHDLTRLRQAFVFLKVLCDEFGLTINPGKTKWMRFAEGGRIGECGPVMWSDTVVERVSVFEYLGVMIIPSLISFRPLAASFTIGKPSSLSLWCGAGTVRTKSWAYTMLRGRSHMEVSYCLTNDDF
jgi:hypothetical protein